MMSPKKRRLKDDTAVPEDPRQLASAVHSSWEHRPGGFGEDDPSHRDETKQRASTRRAACACVRGGRKCVRVRADCLGGDLAFPTISSPQDRLHARTVVVHQPPTPLASCVNCQPPSRTTVLRQIPCIALTRTVIKRERHCFALRRRTVPRVIPVHRHDMKRHR
jgi:hypothetical protein